MITALDIYQEHLNQVSELLWTRNFAALTEMMAYPHELLTETNVVNVETPAVLETWAAQFRDNLDRLGATAYHRVAIAAAFTGDDEKRIDGFHRVYILNGAKHLIDPYSSEARLHKQAGVWLGSGVRATLRKPRYTVAEDDIS